MAVSWLMIALATQVFLFLPNKLYSQSDTTTFEFTEFRRNEPDLILQGDARLFLPEISLTSLSVSGGVGRALYSPTIRLWDRAGRRQANFQTVFTGAISFGIDRYTLNGISFFIAPVNATIPMASANRGNMGLYDNSSGLAPVPLFAAELDYFADSWDPDYRHVGININSRNSDAVGMWEWDTAALNITPPGYPWIHFFEARITYDARQRLISVFANATANSPIWAPQLIGRVEHTFDLKTILPEWVQIGFSASTERGQSYGTGGSHNIKSWSFISFMVPDHDGVNRPDEDNNNRQDV